MIKFPLFLNQDDRENMGRTLDHLFMVDSTEGRARYAC